VIGAASGRAGALHRLVEIALVSKLIKPARAAESYEQGPMYRQSDFGQIISNGSTVRRK